MDNISIISIADSDTSASVVMNATFSPRNPTPLINNTIIDMITPKREQQDTTINTTFTPEDNKTTKIQNDTFSPVKEDEEVKEVVKAAPVTTRRRSSRTPVRKAQENTFKFESPEPTAVPDIVIVPPSTDRKRVRRSSRTPSKTERISMSNNNNTRRTTRQTPLKTVAENVDSVPEEARVVVVPKKLVEVIAEQPEMPPPALIAAPPSPRLLKSIRKRSLSVTDVDPPMPKRNFRVQFHSPGNMEKTITEIDESLYLNFSKTFASSFTVAPNQSEVAAKNKLPVRRKRSFSNAETPTDKLATLKLLQDEEKSKRATDMKRTLPSPSPRKKMPNFAAIHQSIFQQMENLVDFSERKKERAQFLLNPTASASGAGAPIGAHILKPVNRGAIGKMKPVMGGLKKPPANLMKPKNRTIGKKPTTGIKLTENKLKAILQSSEFPVIDQADRSLAGITATATSSVVEKEKQEDTKENVTGTASKSSKIKEPRVYAKDTNIKTKPINLNASTASYSLRNRVISSESMARGQEEEEGSTSLPIAAVAPFVAKKEPKFAALDETANKSTTTSKALNTSSYTLVRGVRMNRHFELLMKHRNNKAGKK